MSDLAAKKINIAELARLQFLEKEILKKALEISSLKKNEKLAKLRTQIEEVNFELEALSGQLNTLELERKKIEGTVSVQNDKIKRNEEKLFSGTITSSKELVNYQEEIKQFKNVNDELESRELEIMFSIDEITPKLKGAEDRKKSFTDEYKKLALELQTKIKNIEEGLSILNETRAETLKNVPQDIASAYNEMKQKKGGIALAVMKDNICDICNMELPVGDRAKIKDEDKIYKCPMCGRLLIINTQEIESVRDEIKKIVL